MILLSLLSLITLRLLCAGGETATTIRDISASLALIVGGIYFLFRLATGEFQASLALRLTVDRLADAKSPTEDLLLIQLEGTNKKSTGLKILDCRASVFAITSDRRKIAGAILGANYYRRVVDNGLLRDERDTGLLSTNQEDTFAIVGSTRVAANQPYEVEVVLLARASLSVAQSQWVVTTFSQPREVSIATAKVG